MEPVERATLWWFLGPALPTGLSQHSPFFSDWRKADKGPAYRFSLTTRAYKYSAVRYSINMPDLSPSTKACRWEVCKKLLLFSDAAVSS